MKESTLVILKPDALCKRLVGTIIALFEREGMRCVACQMHWFDKKEAQCFYQEHRNRPFYRPLVDFITSNPVIITVWEGENAVSRVRDIVGSTDPANAGAHTVRRAWGSDNRHNIVHASDSLDTARREIAFFKNLKCYSWSDRIYRL